MNTNTFVSGITNLTQTLNGAVSNRSSLSNLVDLFSQGVSSRTKKQLIINALMEDPISAIKLVIYLRDVRSGQGNKDIFREFVSIVNEALIQDENFKVAYLKLIKHIPEFGSWKDVYNLYGVNESVDREILTLVSGTILYSKEPGLCAKWFPRQSKFHHDFARYNDMSVGEARRLVASYTKVIESQMCSKLWSEINYDHVPSRSNKVYTAAFLRNDEARRRAYLQSVLEPESGTSMKSSTLYPHEIVTNLRTDTQTSDALWRSLPNYMANSESFNILPVIDLSGSMTDRVPNTNTTAMQIAIALGLYFSEHNVGAFKDLWCNFDTSPEFFMLKGNTLSERVKNLNYHKWGGSTNLQAVFDLILATKAKPEDMPKVILIVSDMEFNVAERGHKTNFQAIEAKYAEAGLERPVIVFWRVNILSSNQPVTINDSGSILINGYSPSIMKLILSMSLDDLKDVTPESFMLKAIADKYSYVDEYFKF